MKGTIVNTVSIIAGGSLGVILGHRLSDGLKTTVMQGLSLAVLLIGGQMALETNNPPVVIFSLLIGAVIGELLKIETRLNKFGEWIESKFSSEGGSVAKAFVRTTLIYCVGAMAIMGAIQDGLTGDPSTLYAKSMLDGFSAIAFASTMGIGVIFSSLPVLLYQGLITLLASSVQAILTPEIIAEMTATGGLLIIGISINILEIAEIKVGNLLPSIFVAIGLSYLIVI
ncbi:MULTISPECIES: DUF554 domain-containing protein [unclassified Candidatus Frackibacter]|uniref:DUF554 domain-containing protein n=1 Tax=unclassified Candidatus Frackibacter TaxID=2648818 RepID=UPI00088743CF|nr:hypothetical protein SAMN04515661_11025 [Candidatus Frackibacter sp. WG11]SEM64326.1 hypothetical protein SAMN04488698_11026 [Candidatus Frackibacter sp. WG12]SFL68358.1 hypothetical protein SAMN04488699_10965 [Candidatus Frackibacter sp. WG13]